MTEVKCEGCKTNVATFENMILSQRNREVLNKKHANLCFDCTMLNDTNRKIPVVTAHTQMTRRRYNV